MELIRFDPTRCGFPRPGIPLRADQATWPALADLHPGQADAVRRSKFRHFVRGRYALSEAYRLAGLGPRDCLLAPSYHCVTMLDPALDIGADVALYRLDAALSPDLDHLKALLRESASPIKALLATHFFGFTQDFSALNTWCNENGIVLIEDCSHVLFSESHQSVGTGIFGQYVTSSPYKFFPGDDGGLLYAQASNDLADVYTKPQGLIRELRGIKHLVDKRRTRPAIPFDIAQLATRLAALVQGSLVEADERREPFKQPSRQFVRQMIGIESLRSSRWLARTSPIDAIIRSRRQNYQRWLDIVAELPGCRAIYGSLPLNITPYMFPLHIDHPTPHFYWLKHLAFPVWRWDEMAASDCSVAQNYRLHLLHLPCHHLLGDEQFDWMASVLRKVMLTTANGGR